MAPNALGGEERFPIGPKVSRSGQLHMQGLGVELRRTLSTRAKLSSLVLSHKVWGRRSHPAYALEVVKRVSTPIQHPHRTSTSHRAFGPRSE